MTDELVKDSADKRDIVKLIKDFTVESIDLTNGLAVNVKNQRTSNACTGFSSAYLMSILTSKLTGKWTDFDPWFIYYMSRELSGKSGQNVGVSYRNVMKALQKYGCITSKITKLSGREDKPSKDDYKYASYNKIRSYERIPESDLIKGLQYTLAKEKLPIVSCMRLYKDSWSKAAFNGELNNVAEDDSYQYNHAMCIYGYDKDKDQFLVLNSHGTDFGKSGRLRISSDYIKYNSFDNWTVGYDYY